MYKYNSVIASKIFEIIIQEGEINYYRLKKLTNKSLGSYHPSDSTIKSNIDHLLEWNLIQKKEENKKDKRPKSIFYVNELGHILSKLNYEPRDISKFLKISQIICVNALIGTTFLHKKVGKPERGDLLLGQGLITDDVSQIDYRETNYYDGFILRGVSKEDVIEKRYRNPTNYQDLDSTSEEVEQYFNMLLDKKIIKPSYEQDNKTRYSLSPNVEQFFSDCWISLFNSISSRIWVLSKTPKKLSNAEKEWYKLHFGEVQFNFVFMENKLWKSYEEQRTLREGLSPVDAKKLENEKNKISINKLKEINNEIIQLYDYIIEKYKDKVIGFVGFKELIISFVCPHDILEKVIKERTSKQGYVRQV